MTKSPIQWARILRVSKRTAMGILKYLKNEKIGDVTFCNPNVTVACRRMVRDEKARRFNREKVSRHREKKKAECTPESNQDVTPLLHLPLQSSPSKRRNNKNYFYCEDTIEWKLSFLLFELIQKRRPTVKVPDLTSEWPREIDLMIRKDKRDPQEIENIIKWCQLDNFWRNNILSTGKLRKHFDQLALKIEKPGELPEKTRRNIESFKKWEPPNER